MIVKVYILEEFEQGTKAACESSFSNFEIDSLANREPLQAGQNWHDVAVPRLLCNNFCATTQARVF